MPPTSALLALVAPPWLAHSTYERRCQQPTCRQQRQVLDFSYLPAPGWLEGGQYAEVYAGDYRHEPLGWPAQAYRVLFLSQSGWCLLFRDEQLVLRLVVRDDEALLRLLAEAGFPLPQ